MTYLHDDGFQNNFQTNELLHGDYKKMSLIQQLCSDNLYENLKPEQHYLYNKFKHSVLPKNVLAIMDLAF